MTKYYSLWGLISIPGCNMGGAEEVDIGEYQRLILIDLTWANARALEKRLGQEKVLEIFRPHYIHSGMAILMNITKALEYSSKDAETLSNVGIFIFESLWHTMPISRTLTERGLVTDWPCCCIQSAPWVARRLICDVANIGVTQQMNSDYELLNIECLDKGSDHCEYIVRNKSDHAKDWKLAGKVDKLVEVPSFPHDQKRWFAVAGISELWILYAQALMEWSGMEDTMKALRSEIVELSAKWGGRIVLLADYDAKGVNRVLSSMDSFNAIMGIEGKTVFSSSDRHEMEISICPFASSPPEIGMQLETFCQGLCKFIDDDYELQFLSRMCGGDKTCHRIIRKRLTARGKGKAPVQ